ncbi:alpha/beta fold hydrolase [Mesomycoplasma molare]|uniref:Alpha/beta hydrolase n=1 Tax=Mesomycoplasma molare TaxID=171288 RepID=A0ABY5TX84_9BACT|nr:alpha/beta hydrolase [Mesomycoplasma molare]UWD34196.1 alpha/beta hydrolase [Mesomycoplasma molare]
MEKKKINLLNEEIIYVEENTGKPKVLFLHGFNSSYNFANQVYRLENRNYDIVAFDFPGCGESSNNNEISVELYQKISEEFIKQTNINFDLVIGHSLGGASALYLLNKNYVKKALLAAPINYNILNTIAKETINQSIERLQKWLLPSNIEDATDSSNNLVYKEKNNYKKNISKIASVFLKLSQNKEKYFAKIVRHQIINPEFLKKEIKNLYKENKDYEFITGINDLFVPFLSVAKIANEYNKNIIGIKDCGHALFFEKPQEINDKINSLVYQLNE